MNDNRYDFHVTDLITDYVLGLLPKVEKEHVTLHISGCADCKSALQQERQIAQLVRSTLSTATQLDNRRLQQLRPDLPSARMSFLGTFAWQKPLAAALLLLLVIVGTIGLQRTDRPAIWPEATAYYTKVAATNTATSTAMATSSPGLATSLAEPTPYLMEPIADPQSGLADPQSGLADPQPAITPVPSPTFVN